MKFFLQLEHPINGFEEFPYRKVMVEKTYREIVELLVEVPRIRKALNLKKILDPSTLCKAFERLKSTVWRVVHLLTLDFFDLTGVTGIDSSGIKRSHASRHYTKRTKLHIKKLKNTLLADIGENPMLDAHITTTGKHDTQIGPQMVERSADLIDTLLGDEGYDDRKYRDRYRELGIRLLIKHREFTRHLTIL